MLGTTDQILVAVYLAVVAALGVLVKSPESSKEYIFASRKLTLPAFVMTLVSTWYGGILEIGRFSYINGASTILIFGFFYYIAAAFYAYALVPKIADGDFKTIPEAIESRFGWRAALVSAVIVLFVASPAPYIKILSTILGFLYGIDMIHGIIICTGFSVIYTIRGGFSSVLRTDALQFVLMYSGFIGILIFLYTKHEGYKFLSSKLSKDMLSFPGSMEWSYIIAWGFIALVTFIDPNFYQRTFAGQSVKTVRRGILLSVSLWFIFDLVSISVGLYAAALIPPTDLTHSPYLDLVSISLPPVAQGIFVISMLSVVMSTIDSFILISGFTLGRNILPRLLGQSGETKLLHVKYGIVFSGLISMILATFFKNAIDIWYVTGSFAVSALLVPLLSSLYQVNIKNPLALMLVPLSVTLLWFLFGGDGIDPMYPGVLVSVILFFILRRRDE